MALYDINPIENKATLVNANNLTTIADFEPFLFKGIKQPNWKLEKFEWHSKNNKYKNNNDFIFVHNSVGVGVVINKKAKAILEPILKNDAEYLPIEIEGESNLFYLLNIIHIAEDAIDLDKSEFRTMRNGMQGSIKKTIFSENCIPENRAFVYPQSITRAMFRGELLKETCEKHQLIGLMFIPVDASQISS